MTSNKYFNFINIFTMEASVKKKLRGSYGLGSEQEKGN